MQADRQASPCFLRTWHFAMPNRVRLAAPPACQGEKNPVVETNVWIDSCRFARLHFITPWQSSPAGFACQPAALRGRLAKAKKNPAGKPDVQVDSQRLVRLRRGSGVTAFSASPLPSCQSAALRGRLAKAKKNPVGPTGFFEDWWTLRKFLQSFS